MAIGSVFDDHHMRPLAALVAKFGDCRSRIGEKAFLVLWIDPGACDDARAVARSDLVLIRVDQRVEGGRIDQPFLDQ